MKAFVKKYEVSLRAFKQKIGWIWILKYATQQHYTE